MERRNWPFYGFIGVLLLLLATGAFWIEQIIHRQMLEYHLKGVVGKTAVCAAEMLEDNPKIDPGVLIHELVSSHKLDSVFEASLIERRTPAPAMVVEILEKRMPSKDNSRLFVVRLVSCDGRSDYKCAAPFATPPVDARFYTSAKVDSLGDGTTYKLIGCIYYYERINP